MEKLEQNEIDSVFGRGENRGDYYALCLSSMLSAVFLPAGVGLMWGSKVLCDKYVEDFFVSKKSLLFVGIFLFGGFMTLSSFVLLPASLLLYLGNKKEQADE